jgi:hypothetical protein
MSFWQMSDAIPLFHHHNGYDGHGGPVPAWTKSSLASKMKPSGDEGGVGSWDSFLGTKAHYPFAASNPHDAPLVHASSASAVAAGFESGASLGSKWFASSMVQSGDNAAGNGGDGFFYGGIIHGTLVDYEPANITQAARYDSSAEASQANNVHIDQSAFQMAGVGGDGGNDNIASGGDVSTGSSNAGVIATGGNTAGNGGDGYFSGALVHAPIVIYHPINIAIAGPGGTAHANQSNTVEIDQSAVQIAGIGGNGGNGNVAGGGSVITLDPGWGSTSSGSAWDVISTGGNQAGNGGDGYASGGLVHTSVVIYDPINIAVAGYNSSAYAAQTNNVHLDQSSLQTAGVGGNGGNDNAALGGNGSLHGSSGGSDAIATGSNGAGNGGSGHFSGSLVDVSIAIYAPINIAIAGPYSTAEADQLNNVHFDQSTVQIAGIGGNGGHGNLASGGDLAMHLLSDLHLMG